MHNNLNEPMTGTLPLALGWFSIALGVAELLAPRGTARLIGVRPTSGTTALVRACGAREIATGMGVLAEPHAARWLWSSVGGSALNLAAIGRAAGGEGANRQRLALAAAVVSAVSVLECVAARRRSGSRGGADRADLTISGDEPAITIRAPIERVEEAWVEWCTSGYSRLKPNYVVRLEPAPAARGTEVRLSGGGSKRAMREELRRFKQRLETGEIPLSDGPGLWRPAQPAASADEIRKLVEVL